MQETWVQSPELGRSPGAGKWQCTQPSLGNLQREEPRGLRPWIAESEATSTQHSTRHTCTRGHGLSLLTLCQHYQTFVFGASVKGNLLGPWWIFASDASEWDEQAKQVTVLCRSLLVWLCVYVWTLHLQLTSNDLHCPRIWQLRRIVISENMLGDWYEFKTIKIFKHYFQKKCFWASCNTLWHVLCSGDGDCKGPAGILSEVVAQSY